MAGFIDLEVIGDTVKEKIQTELNTKLTKIDAMRNDGITLLKLQTGGNIGKDINWLEETEDSEGYNPQIIIHIMKDESIDGIGGADIIVKIWIRLKDPGDYSGKRRMIRYLLALDRLFSVGTKIENMSMSSTYMLEYESELETFNEKQVSIMTWGLGLGFKVG